MKFYKILNESSVYSTAIPIALKKRVDSALLKIKRSELLLKEPVEFKMGAASHAAGQYGPDRTLLSNSGSIRLPSAIFLNRGISESNIVHEYGHHFDRAMSRNPDPRKFWSDDSMREWTGSSDNREIFADMFSKLVLTGHTYRSILIPSVDSSRREQFHSWFDSSVRDFAEKNR